MRLALLLLLTACGETIAQRELRVSLAAVGGICHLTSDDAVECVNRGVRYRCLVAGERAECAVVTTTPPEAP